MTLLYFFITHTPGQCLRYFFGSTAYEIMIVKPDYGNGSHLKTRKSTHTKCLLRLASIKRISCPLSF